MAAYDYRCEHGHDTTVRRPMADPEPGLVECDTCGWGAFRVYIAPAIAFTGAGFYATDHPKDARGRS